MLTSNDLLTLILVVLCVIAGPIGWAILVIVGLAWFCKQVWELLVRTWWRW